MIIDDMDAIIHSHHKNIWKQLIIKHPITSAEITYGTPEMAMAVGKLSETLSDNQLLILGGHEDGIISFVPILTVAFERIEQVYKLL